MSNPTQADVYAVVHREMQVLLGRDTAVYVEPVSEDTYLVHTIAGTLEIRIDKGIYNVTHLVRQLESAMRVVTSGAQFGAFNYVGDGFRISFDNNLIAATAVLRQTDSLQLRVVTFVLSTNGELYMMVSGAKDVVYVPTENAPDVIVRTLYARDN